MNIFIYNRYRKIYKTADSKLYVIYKKQKVYIADYFKKNGVIKKEHKHLIQQKSKKVGGAGDTLVVCSFNVYSWNGYKADRTNFDGLFKNLITEKGIELLLTQEDDIDNNDDTSESVKVYTLNGYDGNEDNSSRFSFVSCINSHNEGILPFYRGVEPRNAIIITDKVFGISIANLHLEGGRFVDLELNDDTFSKYLEIKVGLLNEVLKSPPAPPDIILGDFNSVYCDSEELLNKMYEGQKTYYDNRRNSDLKYIKDEEEGYSLNLFRQHIETYGLKLLKKCPHRTSDNRVLSLENIKSWNSAPFALLKAAGYTYIKPKNIIVSEKINPTNSRAENVIDHVWVKQSILTKYDLSTEIYDGFGKEINWLYGGISDHKPVILTIKKKLVSEEGQIVSEEGQLVSEEGQLFRSSKKQRTTKKGKVMKKK